MSDHDRRTVLKSGATVGAGLLTSIVAPASAQPATDKTPAAGSFAETADLKSIADYVPVVADGVTDNAAAFEEFAQLLPTLSKGAPKPVAIAIGNPTVFHCAGHSLRRGQPFVLSTDGTLPPELAALAGRPLFVVKRGLADDRFLASTHNPLPHFNGDGAPIATSGSQSGTHHLHICGENWLKVRLPPGHYRTARNAHLVSANFAKKVYLEAYGVVSDLLFFYSPSAIDLDGKFGIQIAAPIQSVRAGAGKVTLVNRSDVAKFSSGGWVALWALDLQGEQSNPPNNHYQEFHQIRSVDAASGVVKFREDLRHSYLSSYPTYGAGNAKKLPSGGAAIMIALCDVWDKELIIAGVRITTPYQTIGTARVLKLIDCSFDGGGLPPTGSKFVMFERCKFGDRLEVDKNVELLEFNHCITDSVLVQSSSIDRLVINACEFNAQVGTARLTEIRNSFIGHLAIGPALFGATESVLIENSRIGQMHAMTRLDGPNQALAHANMVESWSFTNGTLSRPLSLGPVAWAVPGRKMFVSGADGGLNRGSPFAILDVRSDGKSTLIDTTLAAKPVADSTKSHVTIDTLTGRIRWPGHGLSAGTPICLLSTGALPQPVFKGIVHYVLSRGLDTDGFRIARKREGDPINFSVAQSGTHTAISNPLMYTPHPCSRLTLRNVTGSERVVSMSEGRRMRRCSAMPGAFTPATRRRGRAAASSTSSSHTCGECWSR